MLEFLTINLLWWNWVVFGIFLITLELFIGTFILLGLGLAAMLVGLSDNLFQTSLEIELTLWIVFSILSLIVWFKYLKDPSIEKSGQSNYSLETLGTIENSINVNGRGSVYFDTPVLGNTLWTATAKEALEINTRVKIIEIKGQLIEVAKV
jgi:membrane protein implicated in regulation of membrane protease activity